MKSLSSSQEKQVRWLEEKAGGTWELRDVLREMDMKNPGVVPTVAEVAAYIEAKE